MKITFLGPAYPYRGGIATIIETLARVFGAGWQGSDGVKRPPARVDVLTFKVQYPSWLFPGRSQFRSGLPPEGMGAKGGPGVVVPIERAVSTVNPLNWIRVGRRLRRSGTDLVVLKYWTPFMAPCFGTIARVAKMGRGKDKTKFIVQLDNIVPHERRWFDGPLTRWFVSAMDGFVVMSDEVGRQLDEFDKTKPRVYSPHPMFDHFGERLPREVAAAALNLDPASEYVMFFGLVREYKGLDLLLEGWVAAPKRKLLVVGEFYDDIVKYRTLIERLGLTGEVIIHDRFVPDEEVAAWFSVADLLVLPYRSATQSGVTQIAYHFEVPMVVTDVGGLPQIVPDGVTGYIAEPTPSSIASAIEKALADLPSLRANFAAEKQRFSWSAAADAIEKVFLLSSAPSNPAGE